MSSPADVAQSPSRRILAGFVACLMTFFFPVQAFAQAGPNGATYDVTQGTVSGENTANVHVEQLNNVFIVDWADFDVQAGGVVQFLQPSVDARVLNRVDVLNTTGTQILGTIENDPAGFRGIVFIVDPAGIMIANGALIDVGQFYAAAGNISDTEFQTMPGGDIAITQVSATGMVLNAGTINVDTAAGLIGGQVINSATGTVTVSSTTEGLIALVADNSGGGANDVAARIKDLGSNVSVRFENNPLAPLRERAFRASKTMAA